MRTSENPAESSPAIVEDAQVLGQPERRGRYGFECEAYYPLSGSWATVQGRDWYASESERDTKWSAFEDQCRRLYSAGFRNIQRVVRRDADPTLDYLMRIASSRAGS